MTLRPIRRALLSVHDKTGLEALGSGLARHGVELLSTGGTAAALRAAGLAVVEVAEVTGSPEILDGRVKTLHPGVHGGLLARRDDPTHMATLAEHGLPPIDLVVVNLYPFEATLASGASFDDCIEKIDVGGPAMIRAAAKNHDGVAVVVEPADYAGAAGAARGRRRHRRPRCAAASPPRPSPTPPPMMPPSPAGWRARPTTRSRSASSWPASGGSCCATARTRTSARPATRPAPGLWAWPVPSRSRARS